MIKKLAFVVFIISLTCSCAVFKGVEDVNGRNGKIVGGSPSKDIREGYKRIEKKQKRQYKREMRRRTKRLGTKQKR
ncbi:hypothetical protein N9515_10205 [Vicingaceae bacterium]|nr:hypothetical protein [Vicingaceae bacterium]